MRLAVRGAILYTDPTSEPGSFLPGRRLQPTAIKLGTTSGGSNKLKLDFTYGTTSNNGNLTEQIITRPSLTALTQTYTYDGANRLKTAAESGAGTAWSRTYGYDVYGNRAVTANSGLPTSPLMPTATTNFSTSTNRLTLTGARYDNAGNLTATSLGDTLKYDAENRLKSYTYRNATTNYKYGPEGRRVQKATPTVTETYVYDAFGKLAAEYSTATPSSGETFYRTTDHLGSTRLVTKQDKSDADCFDFFPFGEQIPASSIYSGRDQAACYGTSSSTFPQQFTGQERDEESKLDYFGARYYRPLLGRFTSPDAPLVDQFAENPQSWNLYGYVRNNPLSAIDPTGRETQICGLAEQETGEQACRVVNERFADAVRGNQSFIVAGGDIYLRNEDGTQGQQIGRFEYLGPDGELSAGGQQVAEGLEARADASEQFITTLAAGAALAGAAPAAAGAVAPAAVRDATAVAAAASAAKQLATQVATQFTPHGYLFTRSVINQNRYLRIGFSRKGGERVFRVAGDALKKVTGRDKIDIINLGLIRARKPK